MVNFIVSLILGMFPEVLFLTLFISNVKDKKEKRLKLFGLLALGYIALIMMCRYQLLFYIAYIIYGYVITKKLYKAHIIDLFMVSIAYAYLTLISFICAKGINNYWIALVVNRIVLFAPLLIKNKIKIIYIKYKKLWNINKEAKIKSITIRNISLVLINLFILIMNAFSIAVMIDYLKTK